MPKRVLLLGGLLMDKYVVVGSYPGRGEDTLITREFRKVGGCPYNVAGTLRNLGVEPVLYSALSDDEMGRELARTVEREGLDQSALYPLPGEATGYCMIVLDREGERTFFTFRGCEGHFDPRRVPEAVKAEAAAVFVTGIYLLYPGWSEKAVDFLEEMAEAGKPILFDPGPLLGEMDLSLLRRVLEIATILTPNRGEREELERRLGIPSLPEWGFARRLVCLAETRGGGGAVLYTPGHREEIPPFPAQVVDTTGAGDSFAGGLLAGLLEDGDPGRAARIAGACGALATEAVGTHPSFGWREIEERLGQELSPSGGGGNRPGGR